MLGIFLIFLILIYLIFFNNYNFEKFNVNTLELYLKPLYNINEKNIGLSFRKKKLLNNQGALFVYNKKQFISMWMKKTYIYLDLLFLDENFIVIDYIENMEPLDIYKSYTSKIKSKYAIELNGGFIKQNNLNIGTKIKPKFINKLD